MRKLYLCGKVTGDENYKEKFNEMEKKLESGFVILNPAILPTGMSQEDYMRICIAMIDCADFVFALDDWKESEGAKLEVAYCKKIGKKVLYQTEVPNNES